MSAPLYSRYRRYAEREQRNYTKGSKMAGVVTRWKRPETRVYSLSARASHEAGWWSTNDPGELLRAMSLHYLPTKQVWIEFDWFQYNRGCNRIDWDSTSIPAVLGANGLQTADPDDETSDGAPRRMGLMLWMPDELSRPKGDFNPDAGTIMGLIYYLYGRGTNFIGPAIYGWHPHAPIERPHVETMVEKGMPSLRGEEADLTLDNMATGTHYEARFKDRNPRLLKKLQRQTMLGMVGKHPHPPTSYRELEGSTRMGIAMLTAALSARHSDLDPSLSTNPRERRGGHSEAHRPIEVDLFIRERPKRAGKSISASIGYLEGVKKGLHTVGAHYAYRAHKDGSDPTVCTSYANGQHEWEEIENTKTQVCIACGQKRWFKDAHQRGDEAYGIVPQKTFNVRVGKLKDA